MEETGHFGPYGYTAAAERDGDYWKPFLSFAHQVRTFPKGLLFKTEQEAFDCAKKKAEQLARVPPATPRTPRKKKKREEEE